MDDNSPNLLDLQMAFRLSSTLAKLLKLLLDHKMVTARMVEHEHKLSTDAKIAIHRLRRRMEGSGVAIESQRSVGYWIEPEAKELITRLAFTGQQTFAFVQPGGEARP